MDITKLGVGIDPASFLEGERQVGDALGRMKRKTQEFSDYLEAQAKRTKSSFQVIEDAAKTSSTGTGGALSVIDKKAATTAEAIAAGSKKTKTGFDAMADSAKTASSAIDGSLTIIHSKGSTAGAGIEAGGKKAEAGFDVMIDAAKTAVAEVETALTAIDNKAVESGQAVETGLGASESGFAAIEEAAKTAAVGVEAALSSIETKATETGQSIDTGLGESAGGFAAIEESAKAASTEVESSLGKVKRRSWETGDALVTDANKGKGSFQVIQESAKTASAEIDKSLSGVKRRSWETADALDTGAKKSKTSLQAMQDAARSASTGLGNAFNNMIASVNKYSPALGSALQSAKNFVTQNAVINKSLSSLGGLFTSAAQRLGGFATALSGLGRVAGIAAFGLGAFAAVIVPLVGILLPLAAAFKAATFAFGLFKDGLGQAAEFEVMKMRLAEVLGSMDKAEERMKSLSQLALTTPFDLPDLAAASLTMEKMTAGAYSSEKALLAVGNAAVKSGTGIDEMAKKVGGIYLAMQANMSFDGPLKELTKDRVISPQAYQQIVAMIEGGKQFAEVWKVIITEIGKSGSAMDNLMLTFTSKVSTMKKTYDEFKRILGEAIMPAAVDAIGLITKALQQAAAYIKSVKPEIQSIADQLLALLQVMLQPDGFNAVMRAAGDSFAIAMDDGFAKSADKINKWVKDRFGVDIKGVFNDIKDAEIWGILENEIFPKLAKSFGLAITKAVAEGINGVANFLTGGLLKKLQDSLGETIGEGQALRAANIEPTPSLGSAYMGMGGGGFGTARSPLQSVETKVEITGVSEPARDAFVPAEGATGSDLVRGFESNVSATDTLTKAISEIKRQSPAPPRAAPQTEIIESTLFGDQTENQSYLKELVDRQLAQITSGRATAQASMSFVEPKGGLPFAFNEGKPGPKPKKERRDPMEAEIERVTESVRTPAERRDVTIANLEKLRKGGLGEEIFSRAIKKANDDFNAAMKSMEEAARAAIEAQMTELQKLAASWTDTSAQVDQLTVGVANSINENMTNALVGMIDGTKSAGDAFREMADNIVADILRMTTQMAVAKAIGTGIGFFTGNPAAGAAVTTAMSPGVMHEGGVVGVATKTRLTDPAIFRAAPRYHQGGMVGLQPGEVPIIAQKGEVITTEDQERMRERLRGETKQTRQQIAVTNVNVVDASLIDEHLNKNPDAMINVISRNKTRVKQILNINS